MAKRGTLEHYKTLQLAERLRIEAPHALGLLEALWQWVARYAPTGEITGIDEHLIAVGMRTRKPSEQLFKALITCGFIDEIEGRRVIHDWREHADNAVKKWIARKGLDFVELSRQCPDSVQTLSRHVQTMSALPEARSQKPIPEARRQTPDVASTPPPPVRLPVKVAPIQAIVPDVFAFPEWFERIYARHPKKGDKQIAQQYIVQHIAEGKITSPDEYERKHREWCESEEWRWRNGAKAPTLAKWTADDGYMYDPPETGKSALEMA